METKYRKIIGWTLLALGLLIIFGDLYCSINIFTGRSMAPEVFKPAEQPKNAVSVSQDIEKILSDQISRAMPSDYFPKMMNLISWSLFAGLLVLIGGKISFIGIRVLKD